MALGLVLAACTSSSPSASPGGSTGPGASSAPSGGTSLAGQTVTVIGTWTDTEETAFRAMVKPWETQTGATVKYQGTRAINDILAAGIPTGVLPDLAGLPGPAQMQEYAAAGALRRSTCGPCGVIRRGARAGPGLRRRRLYYQAV